MTSKSRQIRNVEFVGAIGAPGQPPPRDLPQIAIAGRSNVGKSALLNRIVGRKSMARTSKRPGRTQEINFFLVDERFLLVDLPGYGFARAPVAAREKWGRLIERYLGDTERLLGIVLLVDARRGLSADDDQMVEYLERLGIPTLFTITKADKLNRAGRRKARRDLQAAIGLDDDELLETSSLTGDGIDTLRESLYALLDSA